MAPTGQYAMIKLLRLLLAANLLFVVLATNHFNQWMSVKLLVDTTEEVISIERYNGQDNVIAHFDDASSAKQFVYKKILNPDGGLAALLPQPRGIEQFLRSSVPHGTVTKDRRVVTLTFANSEYFNNGMIQNFVCSLKRVGMDDGWVIVAMDPLAYSAAMNLSSVDTAGDEKVFPPGTVHFDSEYWSEMTTGNLRKGTKPTNQYLNFIWRRTNFVRTILEAYKDQNLDVVVTDGDATWRKANIWEHVGFSDYSLPPPSVASRCQFFLSKELWQNNKKRGNFYPHCGIMMIRNSPIMRELYGAWLTEYFLEWEKEQPSLNEVLSLYEEKEIHYNYLNATLAYSGGEVTNKEKLNVCVLEKSAFPRLAGGNKPKMNVARDRREAALFFHANTNDKTLKEEFLRQNGNWFWDREDSVCKF